MVQQLAASVARVQDPLTGVWWQVLDQPDRARNYLEASASAMFAYAFGKGARLGYLGPEYRALAYRAFDGMLAQFVTVRPDGLVSLGGICKVAGLGACMLKDEADRLANACKPFLTSLRRYTVARSSTGELQLLPRKYVLRTTPVTGCTSNEQCTALATYADSGPSTVNPVDDTDRKSVV